jgi:hypothetical protein
MTDETDEQILRSFLEEDESLLAVAGVRAAQRGFSTTPPQLADDATVGVTERRLLWFTDELETVDRAEINGVERDSVSHQSAPTVVRLGSFAMIAGLVGAVVAVLFAGQSLPVGLGLAAGGVAIFAATIGVARVRGDTGGDGGFEHHRLNVKTTTELVQLWGDAAALSEIADALAEE